MHSTRQPGFGAEAGSAGPYCKKAAQPTNAHEPVAVRSPACPWFRTSSGGAGDDGNWFQGEEGETGGRGPRKEIHTLRTGASDNISPHTQWPPDRAAKPLPMSFPLVPEGCQASKSREQLRLWEGHAREREAGGWVQAKGGRHWALRSTLEALARRPQLWLPRRLSRF